MIIIGSDIVSIFDIKQSLNQHFEMKDLGRLNYLLGLKIIFDFASYYLSQGKYTFNILAWAWLTDCKTAPTSVETNLKLNHLDGISLNDTVIYRKLVNSLVYLTVTHSDIIYAVHLVSQFMSAFRSTYYVVVLLILHYLKGTMFHQLHFSTTYSFDSRAYFDADWEGDPTDRISTSYCFFLEDSLIS